MMHQHQVASHARQPLCSMNKATHLERIQGVITKRPTQSKQHNQIGELNQVLRDAGVVVDPKWDHSQSGATTLTDQELNERLYGHTPAEGQYLASPVTVLRIPNYLNFLLVLAGEEQRHSSPLLTYYPLLGIIQNVPNADIVNYFTICHQGQLAVVLGYHELLLNLLRRVAGEPFYRSRLGNAHYLTFNGAAARLLPLFAQVLARFDYEVYEYASAWYVQQQINYFTPDATIYRMGYYRAHEDEVLSNKMLGFMRQRKLEVLGEVLRSN